MTSVSNDPAPILLPKADSLCASCAHLLGRLQSPFNIPCSRCGQLCGAHWQAALEERKRAAEEKTRVENIPLFRKPYVYTRYSDGNRTNAIIPPRIPPVQVARPQVHPQVPSQRPRKRKRKAPSPEPTPMHVPQRDFLLPPPHLRIDPPKRVVLPPGSADAPEPVLYQSLAVLLADLNKLLVTPHEEQPFHFKGACAIVADPAVGSADRVRKVAWEVIQRTVVAFNLNALSIKTNPRAALVMTPSSAIWMGSPPAMLATAAPPCRRCEHLFSIGVEPCGSGSRPVPTRFSIPGQRIVVALKHFPT
ncbi:hypothetical protein C8R43DRAFT_1006134 [Mycena crocata]|nr:hypothetical protein C8R43DRAFT_1006134 [Mycena crocata]